MKDSAYMLADIKYELEVSTANVNSLRIPYEAATAERKQLIAQALAAGIKPADIARLTGLTRARIWQLR
jgi:hypothetical protein